MSEPTPPGQLMAHGTLFLRARIAHSTAGNGQAQYLLSLLERRGPSFQNIVGIWAGAEADVFFARHGPLRAGTALQLVFDRLFCHGNELHGMVRSAALAPARWGSLQDAPPEPEAA